MSRLQSETAQRFGRAFARKATPRLCSQLKKVSLLEGEPNLPVILEFGSHALPDVSPSEVEGSGRKQRIERAKLDFDSTTRALTEEMSRSEAKLEHCWLNRCIQSHANVSSLSELVGDPLITSIDLPVALSIEGSYGPLDLPIDLSEYGSTGKGIAIAVIDSEINHCHPAFGGRVVQKRNYTTENWGSPHWHGTAVAGIVGAGQPYWGVAPDCALWNYKVISTGNPSDGDDFQGALALQHALEDEAHVANCSWGAGPIGNGRSRLARACVEAWNLGMVIVKSAGNNGFVTCPGEAAGIIVVGATDLAGTLVPAYSGRGTTYDGRSLPDLVAPGGTIAHGIYSLRPDGSAGIVGFGTSFAAPWISGTACRLLEGRTALDPDQIKDIVLQMCGLIPGVGSEQGAGLLAIKSQITLGYTDSMESDEGTSTD